MKKQSEPDWLKFSIIYPMNILLWVYAFTLPLQLPQVETIGWVIAIGTMAFIIINFFTKVRRFHFFLLGGDLALVLFVAIATIGLHLNSASFESLQTLRWIPLIYLLTFSFELFHGLNKRIFALIAGAGLFSTGLLWQTFLENYWPLETDLLAKPFTLFGLTYRSSSGLIQQPENLAILLTMILCYPLAALFWHERLQKRFRVLLVTTSVLVLLAAILTFQKTAFLSIALLFVIIFVMKRQWLLGIITILIFFSPSLLKKQLPPPVQTLIESMQKYNPVEKRQLMQARVEIFKDHPWVGVGLAQDFNVLPKYYEEIKAPEAPLDHAPNTYFQLLATTGFLGFLAYMFFSLSFLLMTLRLWQEIPPTHLWHRVFVMASLFNQLLFHFAGLHLWTLDKFDLTGFFVFSLASVAFLSERYARGIVPDDYTL